MILNRLPAAAAATKIGVQTDDRFYAAATSLARRLCGANGARLVVSHDIDVQNDELTNLFGTKTPFEGENDAREVTACSKRLL